MRLPINIADVLHGQTVESERLELKAGWNSEAVLQTMCAFANDFHNLGGGYIFIGVAESQGQPVLPPAGLPQNQLDRMQKEILALGHRIVPQYHPVLAPYVIQDRNVLVLWCPGGQNRPYKAPVSLAGKNREYAYYLRKGSATVKATHQDEVELISLAATVPFDDRVHHHCSLADLKLSLISEHLREAGSDLDPTSLDLNELCQRMQIVGDAMGQLRPRNVGLLFFNEDPGQFFPQTQIDVVQLPQGPEGDVIKEKTFKGCLTKTIKAALAYIQNNIIEEIVVKHADRAKADRFFNYPFAAIEESVVNAIYHRSYEIREPVEIRVLPDEIAILSYPGPDRSISLEQLQSGKFLARRYRNRRIGEFLKEVNLTEGRGTGLPKIIKTMRVNGSPSPRFETDPDRTFFAAICPIHPGARRKQQPESQLESQLESLPLRVLGIIATGPLGKADISRQLGHKRISGQLNKVINDLLAEKYIERTIPTKPQSRLQQYRITAYGRRRFAKVRG